MKRAVVFIVFFLAILPPAPPSAPAVESDAAPQVYKVELAAIINPVTADFVTGSLTGANERDAAAFLIELDTPGGLDSSMRAIIQAIFASEVPVIVYVAPAGARAASAGALITLAADFAVMAPGTNIGAAHPVAIGAGGGEQSETMKEKTVSDAVAYARSIAQKRGRNVEWAERIVRESLSSSAREASQKQVIDLVVDSRAEMLRQLDGRRYLRGGETRRIEVDGAEISQMSMNWRQRVLDTISNPTVAYLLMMLGILGIFFEISQPGVILPGAVGAIALLLAFFAFQMLPVNYVGVLLVLLGMVLFLLEIKVASFGMLTVGGIVSLALGSLMLIESSEPYLQISKAVIAATVTVFSSMAILVLYFVVGTQRRGYVSGEEGIVGEAGQAVTAVAEDGRVFVHGEYWYACSDEPIDAGQRVVVLGVDRNMRLHVRRLDRS